MPTTAQLQAWLDEVEQAIQDLTMGVKEATVGYDGKSVTFHKTDLPTLRARKVELQTLLGQSRRRALRPLF